jgi:hypothetical protein
MIKSIYTVAAAFIAAGIVSLPSLAPQVQAAAPAPVVKADRLDARPVGGTCAEQAWPYYDAACLRDARNPLGKARQVRIVYIDRLPQQDAGATLAAR